MDWNKPGGVKTLRRQNKKVGRATWEKNPNNFPWKNGRSPEKMRPICSKKEDRRGRDAKKLRKKRKGQGNGSGRGGIGPSKRSKKPHSGLSGDDGRGDKQTGDLRKRQSGAPTGDSGKKRTGAPICPNQTL